MSPKLATMPCDSWMEQSNRIMPTTGVGTIVEELNLQGIREDTKQWDGREFRNGYLDPSEKWLKVMFGLEDGT